jgi:hypothetical protein
LTLASFGYKLALLLKSILDISQGLYGVIFLVIGSTNHLISFHLSSFQTVVNSVLLGTILAFSLAR